MEVAALAERIYAFQKERFEKYGSQLTSELMFIHLSEEIGEIARQLFSKNTGMRKPDEANLKEEIAQAILDLLVLARLNDVNLQTEIEKKMADMERRWKG